MEKIYKVFVSSTYEDLIEERKAVTQALLKSSCVPVGMELFPASDNDQWTFIQNVINDCDYYVIILGDRYGTKHTDGDSYTEKEYKYAISQSIPTLTFIAQNPNISEDKEKYNNFKKELEKKLCSYWGNKDELASHVKDSINNAKITHPRTGWIKANIIATKENETFLTSSFENLKKQLECNEELKYEYGYENLNLIHAPKLTSGSIAMTLDKIFSLISIKLISPQFKGQIQECIAEYIKKQKHLNVEYLEIDENIIDKILAKLKDMNLIQITPVSNKQPQVSLTTNGDNLRKNLIINANK